MSEKTAAEIFKKMAKSENRPEIARLRDIFEYVEHALNAKTSHEVILAGLHELGFKMNINSFRSALQRIRKERGISKTRKNPTLNQPPSAPTPPTPPTPPPPAAAGTPPTPKPAAADIDKQSLISMEGMVKPMGGFKPQKP